MTRKVIKETHRAQEATAEGGQTGPGGRPGIHSVFSSTIMNRKNEAACNKVGLKGPHTIRTVRTDADFTCLPYLHSGPGEIRSIKLLPLLESLRIQVRWRLLQSTPRWLSSTRTPSMEEGTEILNSVLNGMDLGKIWRNTMCVSWSWNVH